MSNNLIQFVLGSGGGGSSSGSGGGGNYPSEGANRQRQQQQQQQQHDNSNNNTTTTTSNNHNNNRIVMINDDDNMIHNSPLDTPFYSYVSSSSSSSSSSLSSCTDGSNSNNYNNNNDNDVCNLFGSNIMTNFVDDPYNNNNNNNNNNNTNNNNNSTKKSILQDAEKTITEELYGMTLQEREGALHDIHGVSDYCDRQEENPDYIRNCIQDLDRELKQRLHNSNIHHNNNNNGGMEAAIQIAINQSPNYVRGMYLLFLRCEEYRVVDAADRMVRHFDLKRDLWGVNKLGRDITLDDFDHFDLQCLKAGFFQLLPQRDRGGRALLTKIWYHQMFHVRENVWRSMWYIFQTALLDDETQRKGFVAVIYNVDPNWVNTFDPILFAGVGTLLKAAALRSVATHYCFLDAAFGAIIKFISTAVDRHNRTGTRLHHGNHVEVQYELMSYGIPISALPINSDGVMRTKEHAKWIQNRRKHEMLMQYSNAGHLRGGVPPPSPIAAAAAAITTTTSRGDGIVVIPSRNDVLFGRGKIFQMHVGNMKFSTILEDRCVTYFASKRNVKAAIAIGIVVQMKKDYGTRFLRQDEVGGLWFEVDDKTAADKVGHGFRNRKGTTATTTTASVSRTNNKEKKRTSNPVEEKKEEEGNGGNIAGGGGLPENRKDDVGAKRVRLVDEK